MALAERRYPLVDRMWIRVVEPECRRMGRDAVAGKRKKKWVRRAAYYLKRSVMRLQIGSGGARRLSGERADSEMKMGKRGPHIKRGSALRGIGIGSEGGDGASRRKRFRARDDESEGRP